ncbi:MAG: PQQ-binding-like beta-propeller repeat protein [Myxococcaceae bacterium]|nr:PQQ-binding-like beta-propeller repeat protein [Myxococcaceae bacterium]
MVLTLRLGERWRTKGAGPRDSVSLEIEGVSLLPAVDEVDLGQWLGGWLEALKAMLIDRAATAQVSLEAPALELCLLRRPGLGLELSVVSLEPEPRRISSPVTIDLVELRRALETATRAFLRGAAESGLEAGQIVALERALREATGRAISPFPATAQAPWAFSRSLEGLRLELDDRDGRTTLVSRGSANLAALLTGGGLWIDGATSGQPPFLAMMGLVRRRPSAEAFELGLALCAALHERHAGWATNPWVDALFVRCTEGLAALRPPTPALSDAPPPRPPGPRGEAPLAPVGQARRVTLSPKWSRPVALGEPRGRIALSKRAVVVHAPHAAHVFSAAGKEWRRVHATRGVAATGDGDLLVAHEAKLACFSGAETSARWLRDGSGLRVGPSLESLDGRWLTRLGGRGALALETFTGREAWRFDPPRTQRAVLSRIGGRLIIGTDSGDLYGLDASDGQVRFRIRGPVASPWPIAPLQRDGVAVLTSSSQTVVLRFAALAGGVAGQAGAVAWTRPLPLENASAPLVVRGKIFVAGRSDNRGAVACLSARGEVLWLRGVPLDGASTSLLGFERGVLAVDGRGGAVRLLPDGDVSWVLGGLEDALTQRIEPSLAKHVLVVPGTSVRLVEPTSGRLLAATPREPELTDCAVGRGLTLFTYAEAGALTCYEPRAVLSVV